MLALHDGYYLFRGEVVFYSDDAISRVLSGRVFKVDQEKVLHFEGMCNIAANNFLELGMLRLHTPVDVRQDDLFLLCSDGLSRMVPEEELAKILSQNKGGASRRPRRY